MVGSNMKEIERERERVCGIQRERESVWDTKREREREREIEKRVTKETYSGLHTKQIQSEVQ